MAKHHFQLGAFLSLAFLLAPLTGGAAAATPTAQDALKLQPVQKEVDFDKPADPAKCTIKGEKKSGKTGWVVRDANNQIVRTFADTNGDNIVDQWSYFKDGIEVYRDIDANFNGKADQCRWLNTAGSRWGLDKNEDGKVDAWQVISAEEATAEAVAALRDRDAARFDRLLLTPKELTSLGLGAAKAKELTEKLEGAKGRFKEIANNQKTLTADAKWSNFFGSRPGLVPTGTDESTADLIVYENVAAMVDSDDKHFQLPIGTLIKVDDKWRLIDAPAAPGEDTAQIDLKGFFYLAPNGKAGESELAANGPTAKEQERMKQLEEIDQAIADDPSPDRIASLNAKRADLLEQLAADAKDEDRVTWIKQLADTVSAAVQAANYPGGVERLEQLQKSLAADPELQAYVEFRGMTAAYSQSMRKAEKENKNLNDVQADWLKQLEAYVKAHPKSVDSADAMLQLAIAHEFADQEKEAIDWYAQIVENFPNTLSFQKAKGAKRRLEAVGKPMQLTGSVFGAKGKTLDLAKLKGKVVLIQYWATWAQPCISDLPTLKDLLDRYGKEVTKGKGDRPFEIIGVNLDANPETLESFLEENPLKWPQIYEKGGLESRPAIEMGIQTLPTMILVDKTGKVLRRHIHAAELESELKALLKGADLNAQKTSGKVGEKSTKLK